MKKCKWCKKDVVNRNANFYCCLDCFRKDKFCKGFLDWYLYGNNKIANNTIRIYSEVIYGHKCSNCLIEKWNGKDMVFDVEHKNGISTDNNPNNVCLLCQNCHSQTPTHSNSKTKTGRYSLKKNKRNENE